MATAKKTASKAKTTAKKTAAKSTSKKKVAAKKAVKKTIAKKAAPKAVVKKEKKDVIKKHQSHSKDTGSPKVQIALLTEKIDQLSGHLQEHPKDNHSRRGLLTMVGKRRKILRYMEGKDKEGYGKFIKKMGLRK